MRKLISLFLITFFASKAFCASPLFHAVIAEKWLQTLENYDDSQKRAFMIGTLFPDIRYVGKIDRKTTHESGLTIAEILKTESPFIKGMRVHTYVDDVRVKFLKEHNTLQYLHHVKGDKILFLKFLEDEMLFSMRGKENNLYICEYLKCIEPEELNYKIDPLVVQKWHSMNITYLTSSPSDGFTQLLFKGETFGGMSEKTTIDCLEFLLEYKEDQFLNNYLVEILSEFDKLFMWAKEIDDAD